MVHGTTINPNFGEKKAENDITMQLTSFWNEGTSKNCQSLQKVTKTLQLP